LGCQKRIVANGYRKVKTTNATKSRGRRALCQSSPLTEADGRPCRRSSASSSIRPLSTPSSLTRAVCERLSAWDGWP
jgi:hypothetical protein